MSFLKSLPIDAALLQIFQAFQESARLAAQQRFLVLEQWPPFSAAERELLAAYVSGLNNREYWRAVHSQIAVALGIPANTIDQLFAKSENGDVAPRMLPVLASAAASECDNKIPSHLWACRVLLRLQRRGTLTKQKPCVWWKL